MPTGVTFPSRLVLIAGAGKSVDCLRYDRILPESRYSGSSRQVNTPCKARPGKTPLSTRMARRLSIVISVMSAAMAFGGTAHAQVANPPWPAQCPLRLGLLVDQSSSMHSRFGDVREAARNDIDDLDTHLIGGATNWQAPHAGAAVLPAAGGDPRHAGGAAAVDARWLSAAPAPPRCSRIHSLHRPLDDRCRWTSCGATTPIRPAERPLKPTAKESP